MPAICDFVGELSYDPRGGAFPLERMRELKVVPGHNRRTLTDRLTGRYRDTAFELVEARLVQRSSVAATSPAARARCFAAFSSGSAYPSRCRPAS